MAYAFVYQILYFLQQMYTDGCVNCEVKDYLIK